MLCFSSQLNNPTYKPAADRLFAALDLFNIKYKLLNNTKDITHVPKTVYSLLS